MPLPVLAQILPSLHLTQVHRQVQDSPILTLARELIRGDTPTFSPALPLVSATWARDLTHLAREGVILLSPTRKGPLGVEALNRAVQAATPDKPSVPVTGGVLRAGDPVTQLVNDHARGVMNGMVGTVHSATAGTVLAEFEGGLHTYRGERLRQLMPAYALTIHRSQGSEWTRVAVCLSETARSLLSRNLAYTAVTRAKDQLLPCGSVLGWALAAETLLEVRHSGLHDRLQP